MASDDDSVICSQDANLLPLMSESPVQGGASGAGGSAAANLPIDDCSPLYGVFHNRPPWMWTSSRIVKSWLGVGVLFVVG